MLFFFVLCLSIVRSLAFAGILLAAGVDCVPKAAEPSVTVGVLLLLSGGVASYGSRW